MTLCHACQRELSEAALAAKRCSHCGAVVRTLAKRTIDDKNLPGGPASPDRRADVTLDSGELNLLAGKVSDPERKHPTIPDRSEMTIEFGGGSVSDPGGASPGDSSDKPTRRSTHTMERDRTLDFDDSASVAAHIDSQWRGTVEKGAKQGHTIRQRETVTGFRSSLPVKSRYVRERRKNGGAAPPATLAEVPDYELLDIIGEGGMGVVYAAHQSSIARTVAVKMLKPSATVREEQRDKFISEAVVTGELDHPNIVPIYDLGANDQGALFYSMKRVRGTPWDKVLHEKQVDENLSILLRVADAVAFAHAGGVIHRDLKPENVMLGDYGEVLVMDWGLARITPEFANADAVFQADNLGGTPAYMAPEMASGPVEKINKTSDVYLLGAILYEIIGGRPPHSGRDVMQCLMAASQNRIDPVRYDGELKNIALKAMATEQQDRYQTVKEFQEAIKLYQAHSESLVLTAHANQNLQKAREANDYALYARALYGFQESLTLWKDNQRARALLTETQRDYGRAAFQKGDFDLAASLLDTSDPQQRKLMAEITAASAERDARQRRLRRAKQSVAALVAVVLATITIAFFNIRAARNEAVVQRDKAVEAKEQEAIARSQEEVQRRAAEVAQAEEAVARQAAERSQAAAEKAQLEEAVARQRAEEEERRAVAAKLAEEYESYVAGIGLAAAKINDNAFDFAAELLRQAVPTAPGQRDLRHWEWGRLKHLTQLSAGVYPAAAPVDAVAYSPDGRFVASGDRSGKLVVRELPSGDVRFEVPHGQYVHCVAYSPDGQLLASGSSDRTIKILDASTGGLVATLAGPTAGHTDGVISVSFSPDGKQLVSGSYDNTARVWDVASGQAVDVLRGHSWWVWSAQFSPAGDRIVTAGQDGKVIVWKKDAPANQSARGLAAAVGSSFQPTQTVAYEQLTEFNGHEGAVYTAAFSPDGKLIASGGYDKMVMIWDPDKVQPLDLALRLTGELTTPPEYQQLSGHAGPVRSVMFSPSGKVLASGSEDNAIRLWDVQTGGPAKILRGHGSAVRSAVFSPDGQWIASGAQDGRVRLWNVQGYQEVRVLHSTVFRGHADAILAARFSDDGKHVITASRDRTAALWDALNGKRLRPFEEGHEYLATSAQFLADGRRLATGAGDNSVRIWNITEGTQEKVFPSTGRVGVVAVAPGGDWLATGSPGNDLYLWDVAKGERIAALTGHVAEVSAVAISNEGDLIASGDDRGRVRLWRRAAPGAPWELAHELNGHSRSISAIRFTPDDRRVITASGDHTCGQWDVATGLELRELVLRHPDWISSLDLSRDGAYAVTTCDDGRARLWRLGDATLVDSIASPGAPFNAVAFSPDGARAVLVSSVDRTVKIWNLDAGRRVLTAVLPAAVMGQLQPQPFAQQPSPAGALEPFLDFHEVGGLVWSAMFAPDGRQMLTIGGNDAQLWDLETRRAVVRLSPHGAVASADISPDGRLVVTGSWDRSAKLWNADTGLAIRKLEGGHAGYINSVEFSRDGRQILTASDDGTARIWNVQTGSPTETIFRGHTGRVLSAVYSTDNSRVLTASGDKTARVWNRATAEPELTLAGHAWGVLCGQFSPDGALVVTGSEDNTARIWDARSGAALLVLEGHTAPVGAVAFSPDGGRILTGSRDNSVKLWDSATGKEILSLTGHTEEVTAVSFSPDGRNVLSASRDGAAIIWLAEDWRTAP